MRLNRFIVNFKIKSGNSKLEDRELFNQIRNVLKLKVGDKIILSDGGGNEAKTIILGYKRDSIEVGISDVTVNQNEADRQVILYCAVLKKENFELVVQKATEVGVKEIVPLITERTIKLNIRQDRLEKIIKEAAEQSGRGIVPILRDPVKFNEVIKQVSSNDSNLFFDQSGINLSDLKPNAYNLKPISVWIGPEGGWTTKEVELAKELDFKILNLGKLILRAETAAIIGTYFAVHPHTYEALPR